jgi:hypothetical protein
MKALSSLLLLFFSVTLFGQGVNITFANQRNNNRNYQVVIDGASYYSANIPEQGNTSVNNKIHIPGVSTGSHKIDVYRMDGTSVTYPDGSINRPASGELVYSKNFQTRNNFDMNITVRENVLVSFTETRFNTSANGIPSSNSPMSTMNFARLLQSVKAQKYQSQKIRLITNAFAVKANYFTSNQVKQLLLLVNSENSRFDLAKRSYKKVTDPTEFITVYDVLNSEAKRDALDNYVVLQGGVAVEQDSQPSSPAKAPMNAALFNQLLQRLENYNYQADRITELRNAFYNTSNYFSTGQLTQLLSLVTDEGERLALAKLSYTRSIDPSTFNQLVALFYSQANRDALNNFIVSNGGVANTSNTNYRVAMTDEAFKVIYNKARNHFLPWDVTRDVKEAFNTASNNFTTSQVKQLLTLLASESDMLASAKLAYPRTVDPLNFSQLLDLFTVEANKAELDRFIKAQ